MMTLDTISIFLSVLGVVGFLLALYKQLPERTRLANSLGTLPTEVTLLIVFAVFAVSFRLAYLYCLTTQTCVLDARSEVSFIMSLLIFGFSALLVRVFYSKRVYITSKQQHDDDIERP